MANPNKIKSVEQGPKPETAKQLGSATMGAVLGEGYLIDKSANAGASEKADTKVEQAPDKTPSVAQQEIDKIAKALEDIDTKQDTVDTSYNQDKNDTPETPTDKVPEGNPEGDPNGNPEKGPEYNLAQQMAEMMAELREYRRENQELREKIEQLSNEKDKEEDPKAEENLDDDATWEMRKYRETDEDYRDRLRFELERRKTYGEESDKIEGAIDNIIAADDKLREQAFQDSEFAKKRDELHAELDRFTQRTNELADRKGYSDEFRKKLIGEKTEKINKEIKENWSNFLRQYSKDNGIIDLLSDSSPEAAEWRKKQEELEKQLSKDSSPDVANGILNDAPDSEPTPENGGEDNGGDTTGEDSGENDGGDNPDGEGDPSKDSGEAAPGEDITFSESDPDPEDETDAIVRDLWSNIPRDYSERIEAKRRRGLRERIRNALSRNKKIKPADKSQKDSAKDEPKDQTQPTAQQGTNN